MDFQIRLAYLPAAVFVLLAVVLWRRKKAVKTALWLTVAAAVQAAGMAGVFLLCRPGSAPEEAGGWDLLCSGLLLLMLIYFLVAVRIMEPVKHITRTVRELEKGSYDIKKRRYPRNDIGDLWLSVVRLAQALSLQRYQGEWREKGYRRFVPGAMAGLLDKSSAAGLKAGEFKEVQGVFGIISRQLKEEIPGDGDYQEAVCACGERISRLLERYGGSLLGDGFSLSGFLVFFPEAKKAAAFLEELNNKTASDYAVLFHWTNALYGAAGNEKRLMPVLISRKLSILGGYLRRLFEAGVYTVFTEEMLAQLDKKPPARYIGFIPLDSGASVCRLYEILGIFGEAGKRMRMDTKLQEGLTLYYKNDFYLARNCFSEVARECPEDGIARWYIFASEYYFNAAEDETAGYGLFDSRIRSGAEEFL